MTRRLRAAATSAVAALLLGLVVTGCAVGIPDAAAPPDFGSATATSDPSGQRIVLRFEHAAVHATLADTAEAQQLAARLPMTLDLRDPMGQAMSGPLPAPIEQRGAETTLDPEAGGIYYVPDRAMIAVFYDDLGQTVPPPGLVRLGTLDIDGDAGREAVEASGNRARVLVDLPDRTSS